MTLAYTNYIAMLPGGVPAHCIYSRCSRGVHGKLDSLKASIGAIGPSIRSEAAPTGVSLYEPLGILDGGRLRLEKQTRLAARFEKTYQEN